MPLISWYVFVYLSFAERERVFLVNGVVAYVRLGGSDVVVSTAEMEAPKYF